MKSKDFLVCLVIALILGSGGGTYILVATQDAKQAFASGFLFFLLSLAEWLVIDTVWDKAFEGILGKLK